MAKPRRGKTVETKEPKKSQPAPIPQYNRTPTPEPPRDPNFVFVPGLHNPLNVGHVVIEDTPDRVETVRDGGKYPTRPGSKKRPMSSAFGHASSHDDKPSLLKRLKSAHVPHGYHARTSLQHSASVALYQAMSHTDDFIDQNQTVSDILWNSTPMKLACIATMSPANGAATMEVKKSEEVAPKAKSKKQVDPKGKGKEQVEPKGKGKEAANHKDKGKGKEPPLGMNGEWNDWVILLHMRHCIQQRLAANPVVPCASDMHDVWGPAHPGDKAASPAIGAANSQEVETFRQQNTPDEDVEDASEEEAVEVTEMAPPKKRSRSAEDVVEEISMGPPKKRSKTTTPQIEESISPIESSVATPADEVFVMPPLKLPDGEWNIPLLPEPEPEPELKLVQNRDEIDAGELEVPKPQVPKQTAKSKATKAQASRAKATKTQAPKEAAPKTQAAKSQAPKAQAPKTEVPKQKAAKAPASKSKVSKSKPPKPQSPESGVSDSNVSKPKAPGSQVPNPEDPDAGAVRKSGRTRKPKKL